MRKFILSVIFLSSVHSFFFAITHQEQFDYNWYAARQSFEEKKYDKALMQFLFCEQINPQDGKTKDYLGYLFLTCRDTIRALDYFEQAYKFDPGGSWSNYAMLLFNANIDKIKAINIIVNELKRSPKDIKLCNELFNMYTAVGDFENALKTIDQLEKIQPPDNNSLFNRCRTFCFLHKEKKALSLLNDIPLNKIDSKNLELKIAILNSIKTNWEELENAYIEYINRHPNNLNMLNQYAYDLAFFKNDPIMAEKIVSSLIEKEPNNPYFLDTYALILYKQKQINLSLFYLNKALERAQYTNDPQLIAQINQHIQIIKQQ